MVKATNQKADPSRGSFNSTHLGHLQIKEKIFNRDIRGSNSSLKVTAPKKQVLAVQLQQLKDHTSQLQTRIGYIESQSPRIINEGPEK